MTNDSRDWLIFDKTHEGRSGYSIPAQDVPATPVERSYMKPCAQARGAFSYWTLR